MKTNKIYGYIVVILYTIVHFSCESISLTNSGMMLLELGMFPENTHARYYLLFSLILLIMDHFVYLLIIKKIFVATKFRIPMLILDIIITIIAVLCYIYVNSAYALFFSSDSVSDLDSVYYWVWLVLFVSIAFFYTWSRVYLYNKAKTVVDCN